MPSIPVRLFWRDRTYAREDLKRLAAITHAALIRTHLTVPEHTYLQIQFVSSRRMTQVNAEVLNHEGDTDVITLDYRWDEVEQGIDMLRLNTDDEEPFAELFICPAVAERHLMHYPNRYYFRELVTYIVHGILHLCGEDDLTPQARVRMKRKERACVDYLAKCFDF